MHPPSQHGGAQMTAGQKSLVFEKENKWSWHYKALEVFMTLVRSHVLSDTQLPRKIKQKSGRLNKHTSSKGSTSLETHDMTQSGPHRCGIQILCWNG